MVMNYAQCLRKNEKNIKTLPERNFQSSYIGKSYTQEHYKVTYKQGESGGQIDDLTKH